MSYRRMVVALAMSALLSLASIASAQKKDAHLLGSSASGFTAGLTKPSTGVIYLSATYANASYGTGGVALRNRNQGGIHISGVNGPTQGAWLYWTVLLKSPSVTQLNNVKKATLARVFPTG